MGNRRGMAAALAALSMTVGLAVCAASAQADVSVSASLQLSVKPTAPYIEGALTVQTQPLDSAGNLVCGPGQTVGGQHLSGEPVSQAACAIPMLDYQFVTRFKRSDGETVRRHTALFGAPTPLNVDADLELSMSTFGLPPAS